MPSIKLQIRNYRGWDKGSKLTVYAQDTKRYNSRAAKKVFRYMRWVILSTPLLLIKKTLPAQPYQPYQPY